MQQGFPESQGINLLRENQGISFSKLTGNPVQTWLLNVTCIVVVCWSIQHEFILAAKPRDILQEMIYEVQRLQEEFAQSSAVDSAKVNFASVSLVKLLSYNALVYM